MYTLKGSGLIKEEEIFEDAGTVADFIEEQMEDDSSFLEDLTIVDDQGNHYAYGLTSRKLIQLSY